MTTKELAHHLAGLGGNEDLIYRRLLRFLVDFCTGYGATPTDPDPVERARGAARMFAAQHNHFWLPCVLCGRWYGGQESSHAGFMTSEHSGFGTCNNPDCVREAARLRREHPEGI